MAAVTKNLDEFHCSQIESIDSSDYCRDPPPPNYSDEDNQHNHKKRKPTKSKYPQQAHESIPNVQILKHEKQQSHHRKEKRKKKHAHHKKTASTTLPQHASSSSVTALVAGRSVTPPPSYTNNTLLGNMRALNAARSASPPFDHRVAQHTQSNSTANKTKPSNHNERSSPPPLTANIAQIEQTLKSWHMQQKSPIAGYHHASTANANDASTTAVKQANLKKAQKILGLTRDHKEFAFPNKAKPQNRSKLTVAFGVDDGGVDSPMNKNNSHSICSVESLDDNLNNVGIIKPIASKAVADRLDDDRSMSIESVESVNTDDEDAQCITDDSNAEETEKKKGNAKIRMFNALPYGLEDVVEGKSYEWIDSKYVRLLQLSTYSTVMGPKVKFVWKNHDIYSVKSFNLQNALNRERDRGKHHEPEQQEADDAAIERDGEESKSSTKSSGRTDEHMNKSSNARNYKQVRAELAYHELEAWIAKQTLDCTGWKNKHNKTAPPPFTKKTMIAPEFGVVLCCIQFDSSLRALRNKQFNQYINGVCAHTPAKVNHHHNASTSNPAPNSNMSQTPKGSMPATSSNPSGTPKQKPNSNLLPPSSSPYEHTAIMDDDSPHQLPTYSAKSSSSSSGSAAGYHQGDTLADYLSKFAPFTAGLAGGISISGASVPQVPHNQAPYHTPLHSEQMNVNSSNLQHVHNPHIDDNEDPDDVGHYSLVLAIEYKYSEKFIDCLHAIEHWLYMIASQIRYLLALNKVFRCDQMEHSLKLNTDLQALHNPLSEDLNDSTNSWMNEPLDDEDCPDRLHTIIPFMSNIVPSAIFKFDQLFSATFMCPQNRTHRDRASSASSPRTPLFNANEDASVSLSYSSLMDARFGAVSNVSGLPSRGLPASISLFDTWFTNSLDNRDKHKLSTMISSHLQTLGRTLIVGDNEADIDRYISTLALFSTQQQRLLSRLSVKVEDACNLSSHYIPELYLQGIVIPQMKANAVTTTHTDNPSPSDHEHDAHTALLLDYQATVTYLQSSAAIKQLQEDLYLAPGPSTLVLLTSTSNSSSMHRQTHEEKQSFWSIKQTAMPHKFKQEQQNLLFQKLFYLRRRKRKHSSSSVYARKRSGQLLFDSPSRKDKYLLTPPNHHLSSSPPTNSAKNRGSSSSSQSPARQRGHERTQQRKQRQQQEGSDNLLLHSEEFVSMNKVYRASQTLNETEEVEQEHVAIDDSIDDNNVTASVAHPAADRLLLDDNESVTATSQHSAATNMTNTSQQSQVSSSIPQPIHAPHFHAADCHRNLTFVEPSLSPMIATIVFGSFNIPQELKLTFLETQFRILLEKASEILLYIEHEQKELLSFYDQTCHVMSCKEFKQQVPMEALYPQIMQKFESQLRTDLQISRQEDLYVLLSISEGFRPNLFSLMFGNPVFDIEVADILRYFLF